MAVTQSLKFHMKFMVECVFRQKDTLVAIPRIRIRTFSDGKRFNSGEFCQSASCIILRTRALCSDANQAVKPKGRQVTQPKEETKQYLTSIGVDCDLIQKSRPTVLRQDVSTVKHHVLFLQSLNLSDEEILMILKKSPELLKMNMFEIQGHVKFLRDELCLDGLLILNILQRVPKFFATPLQVIKENVDYVQTLNLTSQNIRILMKYSPSLFYRRPKGVQITGDHLRKVLLEHDPAIIPDRCLRYMLRCDPLTFGRSIKELDDRLQNLIDLGFSGVPLTKIIRYCPSVLRIGISFITERVQLLQDKLLLSYEDMIEVVTRMPKLLHFSDEAIETKIDLILKKGYTTTDIARAPRTFCRSLQCIESRLDEISELKPYRLKSLNILQKTEAEFQEFLEDKRQTARVRQEKLKSEE